MSNLILEYNSRGLLGGIRLFLYEKKIVYLSLHQDGIKQNTAGFVKVVRERDACLLDIQARSDLGIFEGEFMLSLLMQGEWLPWETVIFQKGRAIEKKRIAISREMIRIGDRCYPENALQGMAFYLDEHSQICGYLNQPDLQAAEGIMQVKQIIKEEVQQDSEEEVREVWEDDRRTRVEIPASEDKWEQLQRTYKVVHPFGDERIFLSIEPKDFIVLQASYQRLVNNSFLLHGFYNYRHLILGPDRNLGGDGNCFYIGVPGAYFEREKMVAVMFGFEGFECDGAVEIGKFGYYMRRVEL